MNRKGQKIVCLNEDCKKEYIFKGSERCPFRSGLCLTCYTRLNRTGTYERQGQGVTRWLYQKELGVGAEKHPLRGIYFSMIDRCKNKNNSNYKNYGARGIKVCERWSISGGLGFVNFVKDMGKRPNGGYSLDRIDNNKGYSKENCRWANSWVQSSNKRSNCGELGIFKASTNTYKAVLKIRGVEHYGSFSHLEDAKLFRKFLEENYL